MFVLSLRKLTDLHGRPEAIARSENRENLVKFVNSCLGDARLVETSPGIQVMTVFAVDSQLNGYDMPYPGNLDEGILDLGTFQDRVEALIAAARPQMEEQVRNALRQLVEGTIEV